VAQVRSEKAATSKTVRQRVAAPKKHFLKSQLERRTFGELVMVVKAIAVVFITVVPAVLATVVLSNAIRDTGVVMSYLRVPQSFEVMGYSSEAATQQLLDEISILNKSSTAAKPKTQIGDAHLLEALSSIETPTGNLDLKSVQSLIQRVLGKTLIQISGEITTRREDGRDLTRLRLRQTPGRETLIDVETSQGPDGLFRRAALNLLEHIDPEIAAGIYWREYRDEENALRLTAIALAGGYPDAEKYALNLKSFILASRGQAAEALAASDRARAMDPAFVGPEYSRTLALLAGRRFDEALAAARMGVERAPGSVNSFTTLGFALRALNQNDESIEAFREALRLDRSNVAAYRVLANIYSSVGRSKEASETLFTGVATVPRSAFLQFDYGEDLRKNGRPHDAVGPFRKAYGLQPDNLVFVIALADAELSEGRDAEALRLASIVKTRVSNGEKVAPNLKARSDAMIARLGNTP
jgi:tetratricopeptide (TPR) repeat protein